MCCLWWTCYVQLFIYFSKVYPLTCTNYLWWICCVLLFIYFSKVYPNMHCLWWICCVLLFIYFSKVYPDMHCLWWPCYELLFIYFSMVYPLVYVLPLVAMLCTTSYSFQFQWDNSSPHSHKTFKRLMGIFRCNGWGPGCSHLDGSKGRGRVITKQNTETAAMETTPSLGTTVDNHMTTTTHPPSIHSTTQVRVTGAEVVGAGGGGMHKFQPFFTLTSGKKTVRLL